MIGLTRERKPQVKKQTIQQEKLFEGKVFKNHRALCEEFGWEYINSTNSKKAQLKVLSQYCELHKQRQKIIIGKIHESVGQTPNSSRMTESKLIKLGVQYNILRILLSDLNKEDIEKTTEEYRTRGAIAYKSLCYANVAKGNRISR